MVASHKEVKAGAKTGFANGERWLLEFGQTFWKLIGLNEHMLSLSDTIFNTEVDIAKLSRLGLFLAPV